SRLAAERGGPHARWRLTLRRRRRTLALEIVHRNIQPSEIPFSTPAIAASMKYCGVLLPFETIFPRVAADRSLSCHPTKSLNRRLISFTIAGIHQPARVRLTDIANRQSDWEISHDNGVYAPETRGARDAFRRRHGGGGACGNGAPAR